MRRLALCLPWLLLPGLAFAPSDGPPDVARALREGNRLFRANRLDPAFEAYAAGYQHGGADPVLAYNLGTTAHHLGRLPEAVLWYRRAELGLAGDPWLEENLAIARRTLAAPRLPPPGLLGRLATAAPWLTTSGIALAWLLLGLVLLPGRWRGRALRWTAIAVAAAAVSLFCAGLLLPVVGPQPAVLLAACGQNAAALPAGSEVWVTGKTAGGWRIPMQSAGGNPVVCPSDSVGLVRP